MDTPPAAPAAAGRNRDGDGDGDPHAHSEHVLAVEEWLASRVLEQIADAREVCRLALVNRNFWGASLSDLVWQKRLPSKPVLDAVVMPALCTCSSKKDVYMHLCKSVFYENGLKKFWLDPASGGECYMISAKALAIIWGDTPEYWGWKAWPGAMFPEVAYLHSVCWFDIKGTFRQTLRPGKYMVSYRMQLHSPCAGWQRTPIKLCLRNTTYAHPPHLSQVLFDNTSFKLRSCPLPHTPETTDTSEYIERPVHPRSRGFVVCSVGRHGNSPSEHVQVDQGQGRLSTFVNRFGGFFSRRPSMRRRIPRAEHTADSSASSDTNWESDDQDVFEAVESSSSRGPPPKWVECDAGELVVEDDNEGRPIEVQFSMQETEVLWWKGGFVLDGVIIRPCYVADKATNE